MFEMTHVNLVTGDPDGQLLNLGDRQGKVREYGVVLKGAGGDVQIIPWHRIRDVRGNERPGTMQAV